MEEFITMSKIVILIRSIVFLLTSLLLINCQQAFAEDIKKIVLLPFDVYSRADAANLQNAIYKGIAQEFAKSKNIQFIERSVFAKSIEGIPISEKVALHLGKETGANYVIMGSLSEFGKQISVDIKVIDVKEERSLPVIFAQGKGIESIGAISAQIRINILMKIAADMKIVKIEFKGNRKIESSAISQVIKSTRGNLFSETELSADIKAIYKMGYFDDVAADVNSTPEGKIITFIVMEKPLISEIKIKGNKAVEKTEIENALTFKVRQILNPEKVVSSIAKIKALYDNKGYYNAEITHAVEKAGEKDFRVTIDIAENERLYIKTIAFEGNRAFTDKELKNMMTSTEKGVFSFLTDSGILKKDQLKQDTGKLNAFYLNRGFINAQVGEPEITYDKKGIYVKISIVEGKQFKVGKVDITGDSLTVSLSELLKNLKINKKEFYEREAIMKDMEYLTQVSNDDGYANADISPRTLPQEKTQTVDVTYNIKKGNQVYFHRITVTGNTKTRDKVIRRQLAITEGELYSSSKLKKSYMDLNRLRYFEEINFQTEKGPDETLTDVNINVKEKPTGMFSIGAGYSAQDKAMIMAQISQQNLFGRGQILSLRANIGGESTMYELSFIEPWLFDMPLWSKFDIWNYTREYDSYDFSSQGSGVTFGYPLWERVIGYVGYRFAINDVTDVRDDASYYVKEQEGETTSSTMSFTLARDTTDDYMFPSKGSKNSGTIEYSGGILQGETSFTRYGVKSSWFFPLPLETVFGLYGKGGYIKENEGKEVPIYERYILGGINSLRGLRDVGPKDPATGDVIGGLTMLNFNAEFIFPLVKNAGMKGVLFYDTGNTWESGYHLDDMRKTAGLGIRWYSPIGPLRLEWGYVLDQKQGEAASRWEFTIGMMM
jgi:outer membrane protein insertion porin family